MNQKPQKAFGTYMWSAYFVKREGEGEEKREKKKRKRREEKGGEDLFSSFSSHVSSPWDLLLPSTSKDSWWKMTKNNKCILFYYSRVILAFAPPWMSYTCCEMRTVIPLFLTQVMHRLELWDNPNPVASLPRSPLLRLCPWVVGKSPITLFATMVYGWLCIAAAAASQGKEGSATH